MAFGPNVADLVAWERKLARYSYKPGCRLELVPPTSVFDVPRVKVTLKVLDSRGSGKQIEIEGQFPVYEEEWDDEAMLDRRIQQGLMSMEAHESREWLRRDGRLVDDPHAPGAVG